MGTNRSLLSSCEDLAIAIANSRGEISQLALEVPLIQRSLELFRATLRSCAQNILAGKDDFGKLEKTLTSIINVISSLEESVVAVTLSAYLEVVKSSFVELDQLRNSGRDILATELAASYAMT